MVNRNLGSALPGTAGPWEPESVTREQRVGVTGINHPGTAGSVETGSVTREWRDPEKWGPCDRERRVRGKRGPWPGSGRSAPLASVSPERRVPGNRGPCYRQRRVGGSGVRTTWQNGWIRAPGTAARGNRYPCPRESGSLLLGRADWSVSWERRDRGKRAPYHREWRMGPCGSGEPRSVRERRVGPNPGSVSRDRRLRGRGGPFARRWVGSVRWGSVRPDSGGSGERSLARPGSGGRGAGPCAPGSGITAPEPTPCAPGRAAVCAREDGAALAGSPDAAGASDGAAGGARAAPGRGAAPVSRRLRCAPRRPFVAASRGTPGGCPGGEERDRSAAGPGRVPGPGRGVVRLGLDGPGRPPRDPGGGAAGAPAVVRPGGPGTRCRGGRGGARWQGGAGPRDARAPAPGGAGLSITGRGHQSGRGRLGFWQVQMERGRKARAAGARRAPALPRRGRQQPRAMPRTRPLPRTLPRTQLQPQPQPHRARTGSPEPAAPSPAPARGRPPPPAAAPRRPPAAGGPAMPAPRRL